MNNKLIIGLDIGIASVGWAVLLPNGTNQQGRIIDLGVRCFDKAEQPKTGEPLNLARRLQRNTRTRLAHKVQRLKKLRRYFKQQGLITTSDENALRTPANSLDPWQLRVKALDQLLTGEELARSLYHLVKHRGYYVARKAEEQDDGKSDQGRMSKAVKETKQLFEQKNYRTVAELVLNEDDFKQARRNKAGDYKHTFYRSLLREELHKILNKQQQLNNSFITEEFIANIDELFWFQRPALSGNDILNMVGYCTHEKDQYRASKFTISAERFVWLSNLNNLRIREDGDIRPLTPQERTALIDLPLEQQTITYKTLKNTLKKYCDFPATSYFTGVKGNTEEELAKAESKTFFKGEGYHTLKKAFSEQRWQQLKEDNTLLDEIATTLTIYKTDEDIVKRLKLLAFTEQEINNLLLISFSQFNNLSLVALRKLIPFLEEGKNYYEACELCGYHARNQQQKQKYLPSLYDYQFNQKTKKINRIPEIKNPVVIRALNQARKVLNELIRKYDSPAEIHIELARDLAKPFEERNRIQKEQDKFRLEKQKLVAQFNELFGRNPRGAELLKLRLYKEQSGKDAYPLLNKTTCAYSVATIDLKLLCEEGYVEIDHILPYSRSYDDSLSNKVLVLNKSNQDKGNKTPYEYLQGENNSQQWQDFEIWVKNNKNYSKPKKERLLRKNFDEKAANEWASRNLNDTRYIARFFSQFVKEHLLLSDENGRVVVPSGGVTATLRRVWGLVKNREASDLHHALDACVIAAAQHKLIMDVNILNKKQLLKPDRQSYEKIDKTTGEIKNLFPKPWETFREEVEARLSANPKQAILAKKLPNYSPDMLEQVKPVFVSRMPKRRNGGALHKGTIYSAKYLNNEKSHRVESKFLEELSLKDLDNIVAKEDPRNIALINALRDRLETFNGDGKKAFKDYSLYKPAKVGKTGPLVKKVKILSNKIGNATLLRGGVVELGEMKKVDVYYDNEKKKYNLIPQYDLKKYSTSIEKEKTKGEFCFSFAKGDLLKVILSEESIALGYVAMYESDGRLNLKKHDLSKKIFFRKVISNAKKIEKFNVDVLGNYYPVIREKHHGMA